MPFQQQTGMPQFHYVASVLMPICFFFFLMQQHKFSLDQNCSFRSNVIYIHLYKNRLFHQTKYCKLQSSWIKLIAEMNCKKFHVILFLFSLSGRGWKMWIAKSFYFFSYAFQICWNKNDKFNVMISMQAAISRRIFRPVINLYFGYGKKWIDRRYPTREMKANQDGFQYRRHSFDAAKEMDGRCF